MMKIMMNIAAFAGLLLALAPTAQADIIGGSYNTIGTGVTETSASGVGVSNGTTLTIDKNSTLTVTDGLALVANQTPNGSTTVSTVNISGGGAWVSTMDDGEDGNNAFTLGGRAWTEVSVPDRYQSIEQRDRLSVALFLKTEN